MPTSDLGNNTPNGTSGGDRNQTANDDGEHGYALTQRHLGLVLDNGGAEVCAAQPESELVWIVLFTEAEGTERAGCTKFLLTSIVTMLQLLGVTGGGVAAATASRSHRVNERRHLLRHLSIQEIVLRVVGGHADRARIAVLVEETDASGRPRK